MAVIIFVGAPLARHLSPRPWQSTRPLRWHSSAWPADGDGGDGHEIDRIVRAGKADEVLQATQAHVNAFTALASSAPLPVPAASTATSEPSAPVRPPLNFVAVSELSGHMNACVPYVLVSIVRVVESTTVQVQHGPNAGDCVRLQTAVVSDGGACCMLSCWRQHAQTLDHLSPGSIILLRRAIAKSFQNQITLSTTSQTQIFVYQPWDPVDLVFRAPVTPPLPGLGAEFGSPERQQDVLRYLGELVQWTLRAVPHLLCPLGANDSMVEVPSPAKKRLQDISSRSPSLPQPPTSCTVLFMASQFSGDARLNAVIVERLWFNDSSVTAAALTSETFEKLLCVMCVACNAVLRPGPNNIYSCNLCHSAADVRRTLSPARVSIRDRDFMAQDSVHEADVTREALAQLLNLGLASRSSSSASPAPPTDWTRMSNAHWFSLAQAWSGCEQRTYKLIVRTHTETDTHGRVRWRGVPLVLHAELHV